MSFLYSVCICVVMYTCLQSTTGRSITHLHKLKMTKPKTSKAHATTQAYHFLNVHVFQLQLRAPDVVTDERRLAVITCRWNVKGTEKTSSVTSSTTNSTWTAWNKFHAFAIRSQHRTGSKWHGLSCGGHSSLCT
jgi:hypothetical protein